LGQGGLGVAQRRGDARDPFDLRLGQVLEVLVIIEGTIGDQIRAAVSSVQLANVLLNDVAECLPIAAVATERLHQYRNPCLVLDH
jgi:hypothetical protein